MHYTLIKTKKQVFFGNVSNFFEKISFLNIIFNKKQPFSTVKSARAGRVCASPKNKRHHTGALFWQLDFAIRRTTRRITQYTATAVCEPDSRMRSLRTQRQLHISDVHSNQREPVASVPRQKNKRHHTGACYLLVETTGLEPVTPCMSSKYSNQLSYAS